MDERIRNYLAATLAAAALLGTGSARAATPVGFSDSYARIERAAFGGGDIARFPIDVNELPNAVEAAEETLEAGVTPVVVSAGWGYGPTTAQAYADEMQRVAEAMPEGTVLQLWNEPNLWKSLTPARTAEFSIAAANAVHAVSPTIRILGPVMAPVESRNWEAYFKRTYRKIPLGLVEPSLNLYPPNRGRLDFIRQSFAMASKFGPVNVTEFDMAAPWQEEVSQVGAARQAKAVALMNRLGAKMVCLFDIHRFAPILAIMPP